MMARK